MVGDHACLEVGEMGVLPPTGDVADRPDRARAADPSGVVDREGVVRIESELLDAHPVECRCASCSDEYPIGGEGPFVVEGDLPVATALLHVDGGATSADPYAG